MCFRLRYSRTGTVKTVRLAAFLSVLFCKAAQDPCTLYICLFYFLSGEGSAIKTEHARVYSILVVAILPSTSPGAVLSDSRLEN